MRSAKIVALVPALLPNHKTLVLLDLNFLIRKIKRIDQFMSKALFSYSECCSDTVEFWGEGKMPSLGHCITKLNEETKQMK